MPPWRPISLLGLGGCWGFLQTAATISIGWRHWNFINRGRWFKQWAGSGRSPKIQVYPCHHPIPWIYTKQFLLGDMLAHLGTWCGVSSCCVLCPGQSWVFSSDFTQRFLIFWVRTWNPSGAKGAQTQQDRISHFFLEGYIRTKGKQGSSTEEALLGSMVVQAMYHVLTYPPEPELGQVMVPTGGRQWQQSSGQEPFPTW